MELAHSGPTLDPRVAIRAALDQLLDDAFTADHDSIDGGPQFARGVRHAVRTIEAATSSAAPERVGVTFSATVDDWTDDGRLLLSPGEDCHEYPRRGESVRIHRNVGVRVAKTPPNAYPSGSVGAASTDAAIAPDGFPVDEMGG